MNRPSLSGAIRDALLTAEPTAKVLAARKVARDWRLGRLERRFDCTMPERPARPAQPELLRPRDMPRRGGGSAAARIALWHALAHIEFNAIDLALDIVGRFGAQMADGFCDDFLSVAADEAMHFALLERKLRSLGSRYGALPAHDGLWQAAHDTRHDIGARLAIVPMVLEARGLDVTPATLAKVRTWGDWGGERILKRILDDEIRHVRVGTSHFQSFCESRGKPAANHWRLLVSTHFKGQLKPPFNDSARERAGLPREYRTGIV